jgi:nucleotide-binding universal stress UspA family protein
MTIFGSVGLRWDSVSGQRSAARPPKDTAKEGAKAALIRYEFGPRNKLESQGLGSEAIVYKKMMVAYDESPEAKRALTHAIELAKMLGSELRLVTVSEPLPAYVAFADAGFPGAKRMFAEERQIFYDKLQEEAKVRAAESGMVADGVIVEGDEVDSLVDSITSWHADLLVIGRRHHSSPLTRIWGGTVHEIAERTRCNILAV